MQSPASVRYSVSRSFSNGFRAASHQARLRAYTSADLALAARAVLMSALRNIQVKKTGERWLIWGFILSRLVNMTYMS
ncbi:MAG: hypothetical protein ACXWTH_08570 [Methylosarcina sp.]